jgi:ligand-binding sensor domain-containing protein
MSTRFFYILICFFFTASSLAQDYNYQHYDLNNGLSGLTVYSMTQDKDGFMWFATETGLSRFDGSNFKSFTTEDGLPDNEVLKVYADSKNRLWILPFAHAICYYKNGKIYSGANDSTLARLKLSSEPVDIYEDRSGNIVVIENSAVHVFMENGKVVSYNSFEGRRFTTLSIGENETHHVIVSLIFDENTYRNYGWGTVEVTTDSLGSFTSQINTNQVFKQASRLLRKKLEVFRISDKVHIRTNRSINEYLINVPDHFIGLSFINDSIFTFNCSDTVFLYNANRNKVVDQFSLGKIVNSCFKDNEGSYWFATTGYGVYRLGSNAFTNYNLTVNTNILPVYSLYKQDNYVYCGTSQGLLWSVDLKTNVLSKERVAVDVGEARITGILIKGDTLLVGSGQGIRYYANKKENIIVEFLNIKGMYNFGDSLLIATNKSVLKMNTKSPVITDTLWNGRATCAYKFKDACYIGTLNGLYKVNTDKTIQFIGKNEPLLATRISSITSSGTDLWIATYGNGIVRYGDNKILEHITENNGLTSDMCRVLYFNKGVLWAGTDKGLNKIVNRNNSYIISTYTSNDGLNCNIINCLLVENDTVFMGTPYGLILFTPSKLSDNSISDLHVNVIRSSKYSWNGYQRNINLEAGDNRFMVDYSGISFKSYGNILYYYRLKGLDEKWHTTRENIIDYASLPAGNYTLELYAINAFG